MSVEDFVEFSDKVTVEVSRKRDNDFDLGSLSRPCRAPAIPPIPVLKTNPSAKELGEIYAPNIFELVFAAEHARKPALQVGLLLLLKTFQRLGYFVRYIDIPAAIISHIARSAGYEDAPEGLESYDASTARGRHMMLVRNFVGVTAYGYAAARKVVVDASLRAARTREDLPDIINVALEELARQRYELHGFSFKSTAKIWLAGNHKPAIRGTDDGIWRRVRLIPFERQFGPGERDENLRAKLLGELPGIINWLVQGCLLWQQEGLNAPDVVRAAVDEYRSEEDTLADFIQDCTRSDRDSSTRRRSRSRPTVPRTP